MMISKKQFLNTFFIFIISSTPLLAQSNLMKVITIGLQPRQPIGRLLNNISGKQNFSFAYNNKVVPADSLVAVPGYRGTLFGLLEEILGENYEFKEVPGYVVLRYAPRKLIITAEAYKDEGGQTLLKGHVHDVSDQRPVVQASVYEKNLLLSTLTDDRGYFELKVKNYAGPVILTVSKEDYHTTSINLLPEVVVNNKSSVKKYTYYPDNATGNDLEHSRFARFFIGSKQLLQGLNVGNFFASSPYQLSLVPGLSTQGFYNSQVVDHLSINLVGGYTAGIDGVEFASLFNINRKDMRYVQIAAIFNFVGGSTEGVQLAGVYNRVLNNATGFQFAGLANKTTRFTGGLQLAILANIDQHAAGVQLAGLSNITGDSSRIQIAGLINRSRYSSSLQVGTLNIAKKVKGVQMGFINIADSSDYSLGVINIIKNGEKSISLSTDESFFTHAGFRSGGKVLYGLIGFGYQPGWQKIQYALDVGIGGHVINYTKFFFDTEYAMSFFVDFRNQSFRTSSIRLLPGYRINRHWGIFAGPAISIASADKDDALKTNGWILSRSSTNEHVRTVFANITGGIRYSWL